MSQAKFEKAVEIVRSLPKDGPVKPSDDDRLFFYQHFKQATIGDNQEPRPGMFNFEGKAKWDAWTAVKGKSKEACYKAYVDKLFELLKITNDEESSKQLKELEEA
ncbi:hypothetical protein AX17_002335 [Amanita inopinata Kibby_2008]|nr:hypothetical protein AX17_002335 [Amanita inopinata Kibby_2008]